MSEPQRRHPKPAGCEPCNYPECKCWESPAATVETKGSGVEMIDNLSAAELANWKDDGDLDDLCKRLDTQSRGWGTDVQKRRTAREALDAIKRLSSAVRRGE